MALGRLGWENRTCWLLSSAGKCCDQRQFAKDALWARLAYSRAAASSLVTLAYRSPHSDNLLSSRHWPAAGWKNADRSSFQPRLRGCSRLASCSWSCRTPDRSFTQHSWTGKRPRTDTSGLFISTTLPFCRRRTWWIPERLFTRQHLLAVPTSLCRRSKGQKRRHFPDHSAQAFQRVSTSEWAVCHRPRDLCMSRDSPTKDQSP